MTGFFFGWRGSSYTQFYRTAVFIENNYSSFYPLSRKLVKMYVVPIQLEETSLSWPWGGPGPQVVRAYGSTDGDSLRIAGHQGANNNCKQIVASIEVVIDMITGKIRVTISKRTEIVPISLRMKSI